MMTASISFVMICWKSANASCSTRPSMYDNPSPTMKEKSRALTTSINGGMATVK